jgi:hypothetical protein
MARADRSVFARLLPKGGLTRAYFGRISPQSNLAAALLRWLCVLENKEHDHVARL